MEEYTGFKVNYLEYLYVKRFVETVQLRLPAIFEMEIKTFENSIPGEIEFTDNMAIAENHKAVLCKIILRFSSTVEENIRLRFKRKPEHHREDFHNITIFWFSDSDHMVFDDFHYEWSDKWGDSILQSLVQKFGIFLRNDVDWSPKKLSHARKQWAQECKM